jgi:hypothetical protein
MDFHFDPRDDEPRWNTWTIVQPVQLEGEERPSPRTVRLCCAASRVGDRVEVTVRGRSVEGWIVRVAHSILHVSQRPGSVRHSG